MVDERQDVDASTKSWNLALEIDVPAAFKAEKLPLKDYNLLAPCICVSRLNAGPAVVRERAKNRVGIRLKEFRD